MPTTRSFVFVEKRTTERSSSFCTFGNDGISGVLASPVLRPIVLLLRFVLSRTADSQLTFGFSEEK